MANIIKDTLILDPEKDWISWPKSSSPLTAAEISRIELVLHTFFPSSPPLFFSLFKYKWHDDRHKVANYFRQLSRSDIIIINIVVTRYIIDITGYEHGHVKAKIKDI